MENVEYRNLQQIYLNNQKDTIAEMWEERNNCYIYVGRAEIKGHVKRISTFVKKLNEQQRF